MKRIIFILFFMLFLKISFSQKNQDEVLAKYKDQPISDSAFVEASKMIGLQNIDLLLKQAKLESNNFKSKLFKNGNNMFGMRKPAQRETFAKKEKLMGYATFDSWIHSLLDYKLWYDINPKRNSETYFEFLKRRNFAQDLNYIKKIKNVKINSDIFDYIESFQVN